MKALLNLAIVTMLGMSVSAHAGFSWKEKIEVNGQGHYVKRNYVEALSVAVRFSLREAKNAAIYLCQLKAKKLLGDHPFSAHLNNLTGHFSEATCTPKDKALVSQQLSEHYFENFYDVTCSTQYSVSCEITPKAD